MLSQIIDQLTKRNLTGWQITETQKTSYQSFLAKKDRECVRTVDSWLYTILLLQKRTDKATNQPTLGLSEFRIGPTDIDQLDEKIDEALFAASLVKNPPFELPEQPNALPDVNLADTSLSQDSLKTCEERLLQALEKEEKVRLSAAEFFIDRLHTRMVNHKGLNLEQDESVVQTEFILLSKNDDKENEFINRYKRRMLETFDLEGEVAESAKQAREATEAVLPKTGHFPVVLSGEPLDNLFNPLVAQASARLKYNKMMNSQKEKSVVSDTPDDSDKITLWSNSLLKGFLGSKRFDSYGTPGERVCLIENNILKNYLADKRYADYLNIPTTGELGNTEIAPGTIPYQDLLQTSETLYHLTAFSAFEPNPITGAFSAEVRSGYEISPAGVRPIKGGSVSGVLQRDLATCRLSKEQTQRERALVPKAIRFKALALSGR